jgi:2-polyprenyl-3-methyl-5-hydroxy-6-metoxy-1,4-benzoquinol methylase
MKLSKDYQVTKEAYDRVAEEYWANAVKKQYMIEYINNFSKRLGNKGNVLDLGCGPGNDSYFLSKNGLDVVGVDFSEEMIKVAKKRVTEAEFYLKNVLEISFEENSFDGIWCVGLLHHIKKKDMPILLKQVISCLKQEGIFFISTKSGDGEGIVEQEQIGTDFFSKKFLAYWRAEDFKSALELAGFKVLELEIKKAERKDALPEHRKGEQWLNVWCTKPKH